jgi:hypothetical protein
MSKKLNHLILPNLQVGDKREPHPPATISMVFSERHQISLYENQFKTTEMVAGINDDLIPQTEAWGE